MSSGWEKVLQCALAVTYLNYTCRGEHHNTPTGTPTLKPLSPHDDDESPVNPNRRGSKADISGSVCDARNLRVPTQMKGYGATSQSTPMNQL